MLTCMTKLDLKSSIYTIYNPNYSRKKESDNLKQFHVTFSIPPRDVTSTKSRCKFSSSPAIIGILQWKKNTIRNAMMGQIARGLRSYILQSPPLTFWNLINSRAENAIIFMNFPDWIDWERSTCLNYLQ
jgi:hypothetical protein